MCGPCGKEGLTCCSGFGMRCETGLSCGTDDLCAVPTCGVAGLPCCEGDRACQGFNLGCIDSMCQECGAVDQPCCAPFMIPSGAGGAASGGTAGTSGTGTDAAGAGADGDTGGTSGTGTAGTSNAGTGGSGGGGFVNDGCPGSAVCGDDGKCAAAP
jgi:hypothetical protein